MIFNILLLIEIIKESCEAACAVHAQFMWVHQMLSCSFNVLIILHQRCFWIPYFQF